MKTNEKTLQRVYKMPFGSIYPLYVEKVEKKGRTTAELDDVLCWLTGHDEESLHAAVESEETLSEFFDAAPNMNPNVDLITGVICGVRVEDIEEPLMQKIRYMDKVVDELAKGKKLEKIKRA
ncbi:DUF2200 domain-containing protein [Corynebacterium lubricantis]|uniref:DUF2200 domain-containing protein n=1 Tax=Corynebacterium lubricantis TaxID=541095 RepID=UPI0003686284|nr:DUF2200 domain-containing protein [Corynebacterium lubricantis]